ncbi:hypothetical protein JCM5350_006881 [Sporobolomyces pararoseus]
MTDPSSSSTFTETTRRAPCSTPRLTSSSSQPSSSLAPSLPFPSPRAISGSSRQGSVSSASSNSNRKMLPSHPSTLPTFYASEASASGDESDRDGQAGEDNGEDRNGYSAERRKREEARQRRRAKHNSINSSILDRDGSSTSLPGSPAKRRTGKTLVGDDSIDFERGQQRRKSVPLEGLGFKMGLPQTDYQVLVGKFTRFSFTVGSSLDSPPISFTDEATFQGHPSRQDPQTTYTSSLGSAVPSPDQSPPDRPSRARRRSRQLSGTSFANEDQQDTPRITVNEVEPAEESETNHVRFGEATHQPERERRSRPRPVNTTTPLETDHIVFPETLPPAFPPAPEPRSPVATQGFPSPTASSFFSRRSAPTSPSKNNNRPPSVNSSHHGIGSYGSSVGSQSSLQLVLDDPIPVSPHFKAPTGRSTRFRGRSNSSLSTEESPVAADPEFKPPSRSARQAKKPSGPTSIVGEILVKQDPSRLYFPSASPRIRPESTASSERSPPLSIISSVFPSRPRPSPQLNASPSPAMSSSSRLPFPPPPASSKSTSSLVFPPPPVPSSPPRYGRSRYAPRPSPSPQSEIPNSPSFASTLSSLSAQSVEQPVFPTLGAQLTSDGLVRSGVAPRRVSGTPWERNAGVADTKGDELDRMMAAQRTAISDEESVDANEARFREREKERKRKNIYNELIRTKTSDTLAADGELDSFQRELLARDTVKKSLGAPLMSEDLRSRTPSETSDQEDADSNGITPSTSASSDISTLPPFPDVPTHTYQLPTSVSHLSASTVEDPDQVEIVLSDVSSAAPSPSPITPTFSYSYHPTTPPKVSTNKRSNRVSLTSSTSDQSHYEDAQEEPSRASVDEGSREQEPRLELSKQQTSLWVLDTLASTVAESSSRPLSDIGETEEPEEVLKDVPSPVPSNTGANENSESAVPPSTSAISVKSQSPSMAAVQRCDSPTLSQRSRSTSSSAPVSYMAPKRQPVASAVPLKTKSTFGKKITSLFGGGPSYNAAALGLRGSGISSRDFATLDRPSRDREGSSDFAYSRPSSEARSHSRSHSHSSSSYSTFSPIPTTPSSFSNATFAGPPRSAVPSSGNDNGANKLADLLSKFEQEDKARFKGIAESRLGKSSSSSAVVA